MKRLLLALLIPAALSANQIWQVILDYPDRTQFLAPTPDQSYYVGLLPTLTLWESEGYILSFGERICSNACSANTIYKDAGPGLLSADRDVVSPEPGTLLLFSIGLIAGIGTLWNSRGKV